ncbi:hypothetical protein MT487_08035 [Lachnospiraceae bacterium NSJ-171]|nr:hypothetical protein [Lachnospiraceae bacterium NSJ-171]
MLAKQEENQAWELLRKDYGERTAAILQEFGEDGLKLAEKYGDDLARIIDNLEPTETKKAVSLINSYGDDALEMFKEGKSFDEVKKVVEGGLNKAFVNELPEILKQKRITLDEFNNLRLRDVADLTDSEKEILKFIRNSVPMPNENTLMQKVITVEDIEKYLNGTYTQVGGFVTRAIDVENLKTYDDLYKGLRLDYPESVFNPTGDDVMGMIRFTTEDFKKITIPYRTEMGGNASGETPFTGNGFTKATNGNIIPEFQCSKYIDIKDGAQLIELRKDGTEKLRAIYDKDTKKFVEIKR